MMTHQHVFGKTPNPNNVAQTSPCLLDLETALYSYSTVLLVVVVVTATVNNFQIATHEYLTAVCVIRVTFMDPHTFMLHATKWTRNTYKGVAGCIIEDMLALGTKRLILANGPRRVGLGNSCPEIINLLVNDQGQPLRF
jgi:hypothetical protein